MDILNQVELEDTVVGRGYNTLDSPNISGNYCKKRILDLDNGDVERIRVGSTDFTSVCGKDQKTFSMNLSTSTEVSLPIESIGSIGFSKSFSSSIKNNALNEYGRISYVHQRSKEILRLNKKAMRLKLNPDFKESLDNPSLAPENLFNDYGTHLLSSARMGGSLMMNFTYHHDILDTEHGIETMINADIAKVFSAKRKSELSVETGRLLENSIVKTACIGGNPFETGLNFDFEKFGASFNEWAKSLQDEKLNPLYDVNSPADLIPIWEFCSEAKRKQEIEEYYIRKAESNKNKLLKFDTFVSDIQILSGITSKEALKQLKTDYILIDKDLSKNAGGWYKYLAYKLTSGYNESNNHAYTNLVVDDTKEKNPKDKLEYEGVTYERLQPDIKNRTFKRFIAGTKDKSKQTQRIKRLDVVYDSHLKVPGEYVRKTQGKIADLNEGCSSKSIYIVMVKEDKN
jgi:hypothetical protein